jgi:hypothetical protein
MTIYINADTNEYPRYEADVLLNPTANWIAVADTPSPSIANDEMPYQIEPILIDGKYIQQWQIRKLSDDELSKPIS